jgi:imidazoleglycerol-phosphate dehydratase
VARLGEFSRKTRETHIDIKINIDGTGAFEINTGIGFFNHMLETISKHSLTDLRVDASGDINVDYHHLVEDTGILLGKGLNEILKDKAGIRRYGYAVVPLDEALVEAVLDISGRPYCRTNLSGLHGDIGNFNFELGDVFFKGFSSMGYTLHITVRSGDNLHHVLEAACKAFARALRMACEIDARADNVIPSTKEYIEKV